MSNICGNKELGNSFGSMSRRRRGSVVALLVVVGTVSAFVLAGVAASAKVPAQEYSGKESCADRGMKAGLGYTEYQVDPLAANADHTGDLVQNIVPGSNNDYTLSFRGATPRSANVSFIVSGALVAAVFVKGDTGGNFYDYRGLSAGGGVLDLALAFPQGIGPLTFCLVAPGSGSAPVFRSIKTQAAKNGVLVSWATATEVDVLGFNVYRQVKGTGVKANKSLLVARAGTTGRSYSWLDKAAKTSKTATPYWVQAVNENGSRTWIGPARVVRR